MKTKFNWNEKDRTATCVIEYKGMKFVGQSYCNSKDIDMMSERTGLYIAELRATIKYLAFIRDFEIQQNLKALKQLYYSISNSKQYNKKSYESKMLYRQIKNNQADLDEIKDQISKIKGMLKEYIDTKEKIYSTLRRIRENNSEAKDN